MTKTCLTDGSMSRTFVSVATPQFWTVDMIRTTLGLFWRGICFAELT